MTCETTGYLVERNNEGIVLALNRTVDHSHDDKQFGDFIVIPKGAVKKVRRVK